MSPTHLLSTLGRLSLQAAVVVAVILLVQAAFRRWLTPRWRCALWLLLIARLLLPVSLESTVSIFNFVALRRVPPLAAEQVTPPAPASVPDPARTSWDSDLSPSSANGPAGHQQVERVVPNALVRTLGPASALGIRRRLAPPRPATHSTRFLALLWLAGFTAFMLQVAFRALRWVRRFAGSPEVTDPAVIELVQECARRLGLRTRFAVYETRAVSSPVLYGLFRPRLVLPRGFVERFNREEVGFVVLHEMVHFKRGDLILNWLTTGLQAIHWFNPAVWFGFTRWRADRELACDAAVLEAVGDGRNRSYGETIIQLLEGCMRQPAVPGHVGVLEAPGDLRMRIALIMDFKPPSRWSVCAFLLLAGVGIGCLTNARFPIAAQLPVLPPTTGSGRPSAPAAPLVSAAAPALPSTIAAGPRTGPARLAAPEVSLPHPVRITAAPAPRPSLPVVPPVSAPAKLSGPVQSAHVAVVALPAPVAAAPAWKAPASEPVPARPLTVAVTGELTAAGRKLEHPTAGHPVYYIPVATGYKDVSRVWSRSTPPPAATVERAIMGALAGAGYSVATKASPPALILTFGWGYAAPERSRPSPPGQLQAYKLSPLDPWMASTSLTREKDLRDATRQAQAYVLLVAFDYAAWRRHQVVPLWSSRISAPRTGRFDQIVPSMLAAAAPYFGRETEETPTFATATL